MKHHFWNAVHELLSGAIEYVRQKQTETAPGPLSADAERRLGIKNCDSCAAWPGTPHAKHCRIFGAKTGARHDA